VVHSLAQIAIDEGLVAARTIGDAAAWARRHGQPLVVALVQHAGVDEDALVNALARRLGASVASLDFAEPEALSELPHALAVRFRALPLSLEVGVDGPRVLRVAMADPTDELAVAEIESQSGCRVEPLLATLALLDEATERAYRGFVTVVMAGRPPSGLPLGESIPPAGPTTQPFHRLEDEAPVELRLRALIELLQEKRVISDEEWQLQLKRLLREKD
jgi:hypothetical protein